MSSENLADRAIMHIASLRLTVGMLGERDNAGWWNSGFLSQTSLPFLAPVFSGNVLQAQYHGVLDAAKRVHDDRIGIGNAFHLFRLPESFEQRLFEAVQIGGALLITTVESTHNAKATLSGFADKLTAAKMGPALISSAATLDSLEWIGEAASLYDAAFSAGLQCFPYIPGSV